MATKRIVVDPVTRIEGHLRIEAMLGEDGTIQDAISSGTMWRGIELILKDRDPRDAWAFTERICGVCTTVHALASIRAVENALDIQVPKNADIIRNIMFLTQMVQDHVIHFYHLHALDWVDVVSALGAEPEATAELNQAVSPRWPLSSPGYYADVKATLQRFVEGGQLGLFANAYWGHPAYKLPPEANLMAVAHYLEALKWQKELIKIHTIFGGKNPHPNYLVGGMPCAIDLESDNAINIERLNMVKGLIEEARTIVEQLYIPDLLAVASFYPEWTTIGGGLGNYMSYGDLPQAGIGDPSRFRFPRGAILDKNLGEVLPVDPTDADEIQEHVTHSWYEYPEGKEGLHPYDGVTKPSYTGPTPPYKELDENAAYSWLKTPRWRGHAMEVGPLARMLIGYASGREDFRAVVDGALARLDVPATALFSTLGRTAARGLETQLAVQWLREEYDALVANLKNNITATADRERWDPDTWPKEAKGFGFSEAPRGALGHWVHIRDGKIENYQAVVPTTWNASPRDAEGRHGAYEAALLGTPMADPEQPVEILRTIHSFDPCLACASHVFGPDGRKLAEVVVRQEVIMANSTTIASSGPVGGVDNVRYRRIYVWEKPIRLVHWVNALAIVVLFSTGLYIANPVMASTGEPYDNFIMGRVRQIHFIAAFVFLIMFLVRIYWFWVGNEYARSGFPFVWRPSWWRDLFRQGWDYVRLEFGHPHLGHNSLAGLAYTIFVIGLGWAQIFTGLALFSESSPGGFWDGLVGWVIPLMGGSFRTHMWHHLFAWGFVCFAILHVYIVTLDGRQYRNGLISSMIMGMKFERVSETDDDRRS